MILSSAILVYGPGTIPCHYPKYPLFHETLIIMSSLQKSSILSSIGIVPSWRRPNKRTSRADDMKTTDSIIFKFDSMYFFCFSLSENPSTGLGFFYFMNETNWCELTNLGLNVQIIVRSAPSLVETWKSRNEDLIKSEKLRNSFPWG